MQSNKHAHFKLAAVGVGALLVLGSSAIAAGADSTAEISPSQIALDQAAELRVAVADGSRPALSHVDGLHFQRTGQSTEMTDINGTMSQHTWVVYQVVADQPGSYNIPVGGHTLTLKVGPAGSGRAPAAFGSRRNLPSDPDVSTRQGGQQGQQGSLALLRVVLPSKKLFIGQSVPVTFKAYFRAGTEVTLSGVPSLGIPAFTFNHMEDKPRQSVESIGGVPYRVATWTGQASAAMPGHFTTQASLPIVARYREVSQRPAADPFADMLDEDDAFSASPSAMIRSFMKQSAFGGSLGDVFGQVREREITLHAPVQAVEVLAPPSKGQPVSYNGAVGRFDVSATLVPSSGAMFAPMTLRIEVTGQGNLDRVSIPGLASSPNWKTYPPSAKVTPEGTKIFEQAVVPQSGGRIELPSLSFSFFDPEQKQYVTRSTAPIMADIAVTQAGTTAPIANLPKLSPKLAEERATGLRPNQIEEGRSVATLLPPYRRSWFWPVVAVPWLGLAIVFARPRARGFSERTHRRALRETVAQHRTAMKSAVAAGDAIRFHEAAGAALRERLGEMWKIAPDAITSAEAAARMGQDDEPIVAELRSAERLRYGGAAEDPSTLTALQQTIERRLDQLENRT
ncbi:MAG TPA: BatD family protein [Polyangia bacterium]